MQKMSNLLPCVIICVCTLLIGCEKDSEDNIPKVPKSGAWNGSDLHLFISVDGKNLTSIGSTLEENASLIVVAEGNTCAGYVTMSKYFYSDIPITSMNFNFTSSEDNIAGTFSQNDICTANGNLGGTMYYPSYCTFTLNFSSLVATPEVPVSDSTKAAKNATFIDYYPDGKVKTRVLSIN